MRGELTSKLVTSSFTLNFWYRVLVLKGGCTRFEVEHLSLTRKSCSISFKQPKQLSKLNITKFYNLSSIIRKSYYKFSNLFLKAVDHETKRFNYVFWILLKISTDFKKNFKKQNNFLVHDSILHNICICMYLE